MSCYIVQKITIDRILSFIDHNQRELSFLPGWSKTSYFSDDELTDIGQKMIDLNTKAFQSRYQQFEHVATEKYQYTLINESKYQYLQSLKCFLYQCCEGNIPNDPLYISLSKLEMFMTNRILADLPEMKSTKWE